jgi:AcrR family transcriptional regulator
VHRKPAAIDRIKREKIRRMDEILLAARSVMLAKSYTGATMDEIAAEAGITKPTIYQYFRTKDELIVALVEPLIHSLATKLKTIRTGIEKGAYASGKEIIADVFNVYYGTFERDVDLFRLFIIFLQVGMTREMSVEAARKIEKLGRSCFEEGNRITALSVQKGFLKETNIHQTTDFVWASFWGIVQVEQNKWGGDGVSPFLRPVLAFGEKLLVSALVRQ